MIGVASQPIQIRKPALDHVEQSSDNIWRACGGAAIENALKILQGESVPKEMNLRPCVFTQDNVAKGGVWLP